MFDFQVRALDGSEVLGYSHSLAGATLIAAWFRQARGISCYVADSVAENRPQREPSLFESWRNRMQQFRPAIN